MVPANGSTGQDAGALANVRSLLRELASGPRRGDGVSGDDPAAGRLEEARGDIESLRRRLDRFRERFPHLRVGESEFLRDAALRARAAAPPRDRMSKGREPRRARYGTGEVSS